MYLVVITGPEHGRFFQIQDGQILSIGRGQASDTKLNDPRMSRVHCHVEVDGSKTILRDNGSTSGTFFGDSKIQQSELNPGDTFKAGETVIRFQLDKPTDETTIGGQSVPVARAATRAQDVPLPSLVGQSFANFRLEKIITAGNAGMVFQGVDTENQQTVAVKVLTPDLSNSEEQKERFVRAMKTMLPIRHPNIVRILNAGKKGPFCWAAMEFIQGESLVSVIERIGIEGMLDWRIVWRAAVHIGRALEEAAEHQIVHRNVTPANILQRSTDKVCLLGDLMLAKATQGILARQVTKPGQLIGDIPYMSPERTRDGAEVDVRSDIYGLGATLYALLTGRPPFESNSLPELVRMVREETPSYPKETQMAIDDKFQDAIMMMLAKTPEDRFESPRTMLRDLERVGKFNGLSAD